MSFRDQLEPALMAGDVVGAWELLDSLDPGELTEARAWFEKQRRWSGNLWSLFETHGTVTPEEFDDRMRRHGEAVWIVALCALVLCGPVTAARRVPWRELGGYREQIGEAMFVHRLWEKDPAWVEKFADEASSVSLGAQASFTNGTLAETLRSAVVHHGLPCPTGPQFVAGWLFGTPVMGASDLPRQRRPTVEEWLLRDPLMPDVLLLRLASDEVGSDTWLPDVLPGLVDRGAVTRQALLEVVFDALTRPRRPSAQTVLATCVTSLGVTGDEFPGGLAYLLGVMATSKGSVGNVLLPYAAELVATSDDLLELTHLVAGRPEKRHKRFVLGILKNPATRERIGTEPVAAALRVLAEDDDATFAGQVGRVLEKLPGALPVEPLDVEPAMPTGLWQLVPPGPGTAPRRWPWGPQPGWAVVTRLRRDPHPEEVTFFVHANLDAIRDDVGSWQLAARSTSAALASSGRLALPRFTRVLEDWFLGGGLSAAYPVALTLAGECAAQPRLPSGTADLLRLLVQYAVEVPADNRPDVPASVRDLAGRSGRTSAQVEASRLVAALASPGGGREPGVTSGTSVTSGATSAVGLPPFRGLWRTLEPAYGPDSETVLQDPFAEWVDDPAGLGEAIGRWIGTPAGQYFLVDRDRDVPPGAAEAGRLRPTEPYRSDQALAAVVRATAALGHDAVRRAVPTSTHAHLDPVLYALMLWTQGRLDAATYWRLGDPMISSFRLTAEWRGDPDLTAKEVGTRSRAMPSLVTQLEAGWSPEQVTDLPGLPDLLDPHRFGFEVEADQPQPVLVSDVYLASPGSQLTLARAAEALLLADRSPILLCTPTRADHTLTFDDLLARLAETSEAGGKVGPLDLVQALHRLQPVDACRSAELDHLRPVVTASDLEAPADGRSRDALDLVRTWVSAGGLPPLRAVAERGGWRTPTRAPVSFATCAAAPDAIRREGWWIGWTATTAGVVPGWPDRTWETSFGDGALWNGGHLGLASRVPGAWAVPMHDAWLRVLVETRIDVWDDGDMKTLRDTLAPCRLVPEHLAAAAVGRHRAGTLHLGKAMVPLRVLCDEGYLSALWRPLLAAAECLAGVTPRPTDLQALLRLLHSLAVEAPDPEPAPEGIRALADAKGSTKAHVEARALVATLDACAAGREGR